MNDVDLRLDGNAAAGLLAELFAFDVTTAHAMCAGCGVVAPIGALPAYGQAMGIILRCASCDTALIRVSRLASGFWLDLRGACVLRVQT